MPLTIWTFVGKVMSLLFNMLSRVVIAFLPRSKHLLISWLQSPSAVILKAPKIKPLTVSIVSPSICHEAIGLDAMILVFSIQLKYIYSWKSLNVHSVTLTQRSYELFHQLVSQKLLQPSGSRSLLPSGRLSFRQSLNLSGPYVAQLVKHLPAMRETWVQFLGQEVPLEKEMATHSSILAWRIPWTEEPGGLQPMLWQRVRHD